MSWREILENIEKSKGTDNFNYFVVQHIEDIAEFSKMCGKILESHKEYVPAGGFSYVRDSAGNRLYSQAFYKVN